jgi:hypothetical protein
MHFYSECWLPQYYNLLLCHFGSWSWQGAIVICQDYSSFHTADARSAALSKLPSFYYHEIVIFNCCCKYFIIGNLNLIFVMMYEQIEELKRGQLLELRP